MFGVRNPGPSARGTRFRLFPQPPFGSPIEAETVRVSSPPGSVGAGPADERMYAIEPAADKLPYGINRGPRGTAFAYFPPYDGPVLRPVPSDVDGHFDYLAPGMPGFELAHLFGCVRFTLDVWERYAGRPMPWHFASDYRRLELVSLPGFDNAQAGYGFLEVGHYLTQAGVAAPFNLNFDIIAHEVGHLILYSLLGEPAPTTAAGEYYGFHESAADVVALIAAAHFDSVIDGLLADTRGNLYVLNRLNRIGEVSDNEQIRMASNSVHLAAFEAGWREEHALSLPLTGALFDIWVDIFHEELLERRLISEETENLADLVERRPEHEPLIQALFDDAYTRNVRGFREALIEARDWLGTYVMETWSRLTSSQLRYGGVAATLLDVDQEATGGRFARLIRRNFGLRGIGSVAVGPPLGPPSRGSHACSARTLRPGSLADFSVLSYRERWEARRADSPALD